MNLTEQRMPAQTSTRWLANIQAAPIRTLFVSMIVALAITMLIFQLVMTPSQAELTSLLGTLAISALISLAVGFFLYRQGLVRSPSLSLTLMMTYVWAALSTLFNVWVMPQFMFASHHDLLLAVVLLVFAGIIATSFGVFVSATVTNGLRDLAQTAQQVADGDLSARVSVLGRDEVSQAANAFNQMATQLQKAEAQREEVELLRQELIAWVSHDLRTPLTSIRALTEALHDGMVADKQTRQRYYHTILGDVQSLNLLIDDLFELAQLDAGLKLELSSQSLSDLISDAVERFRTLGNVEGVSVDGDVGEGLDSVLLNPQKIGRVLSNLLGNALKHTPTGGQVQVTAHRQAGKAVVMVQDSGQGFSQKDLPRLFEKFYRGEEARSRATGGAGLGLAIAKSIVQAHGGRIWAENVPKGGALVGFELPA